MFKKNLSMREIITESIICLLLSFVTFACVDVHESKSEIEVLALASCVDKGEYHVEKLSDYAKSLHYIPLETDDRALLGWVNFEQSYFGNGFFYLYDSNGDKLYKFSESGKFVSQIGTKGNGPGEYVYMSDIDIDFLSNKLYIKNSIVSLLEYTTEGEFIRSIPIKKNFLNKGYNTQHFQLLSADSFFFEIASCIDNQYMGMFSDDSFEEPVYLVASDPIPLDEDKNVKFVVMDAKIYRTGKDCYFYQLRSDTIYQINKELLCLTPKYVIDYNRYKPNEKKTEVVHSSSLLDSERYIFGMFTFGKLAPEPFTNTIFRGGRLITYTDVRVYSVYDKRNKIFKLLRQPIPKQFGFLNDLDGGVPFWPNIISSDGKSMFMLCPAETFIATYSGKENISDEVKNILSQIDEESNPVIVRADFK